MYEDLMINLLIAGTVCLQMGGLNERTILDLETFEEIDENRL